MDYKYNAIILNKNDVGETDRIYTVYTLEAGKIRLLAKGVRKPNAKLAGSLEPITYSEIFVAKSRGRGNITGAIVVDNFSAIKENISALENIFYAFGLFFRLVSQEEKDEAIFSLLLEYVISMEKNAAKDNILKESLTQGFLVKLLEKLGYGIQTGKCVLCGKKIISGQNYFSSPRGGIICSGCSVKEAVKIKISDNAIKLIRVILKNKLKNLVKLEVNKPDVNNLKTITASAIKWING